MRLTCTHVNEMVLQFLTHSSSHDAYIIVKASKKRLLLHKLASLSLIVISSVRMWGMAINW